MRATCHRVPGWQRGTRPERPASLPIRFALVVIAVTCAFPTTQPSARAAALETTGPVVELPKFEVTDTRILPPPEKWRYAEIPGFEILSSISERETRRFVNDFLLLQEAMNVIMPGLRASPVAVPTSLILTGRGDRFQQFVPVRRGEDRYRTNSLFFHETERGVIVVDFELPELRLDDNTTIESDPYRSFYREYFRYIIRRNLGQRPPPWFEEGLVQLFASIDFQKKWISFAMIGDGFGGERTGDFNRLLARRSLLPLNELFANPPRRRGSLWNAQAYAFVHMCLYGRGQRYQRGFVQFLQRLEHEPASEELFKECFKMDYKKMALELRGYIDFTDYKFIQFSAKKGQALPDPPAFQVRDAPDAVVGRIKGEALRLAGHGQDAHNALIAPYVRGERDPRLLAALGLDEVRGGHDERALKFLQAAANARVDRARAYLELGRLRLKLARAAAGPEGRLDATQLNVVLTPLFTARGLPPPLAEVYTLIADAWLSAAVAPHPDHFSVLLEGIRLFPRDLPLLARATRLAAERDLLPEARALAERGVNLATNEADREPFRAIATSLESGAVPADPAVLSDAAIVVTPVP
jgi:hypothetical protein